MSTSDMSDVRARREGMAEAVVRVVLSRRAPMVTAEVWCDLLGLTHQDIRDAMQRLKVNPTTPLVVDHAPRPIESAGVRRRDGRHANHRPRNRMNRCHFCGQDIMVGKPWQSHMAANHPAEWAAELTASILARYDDLACPTCGAPITVEVTVLVEATCACHSEPSWYCPHGDCGQEMPLSQVEAHQMMHITATVPLR